MCRFIPITFPSFTSLELLQMWLFIYQRHYRNSVSQLIFTRDISYCSYRVFQYVRWLYIYKRPPSNGSFHSQSQRGEAIARGSRFVANKKPYAALTPKATASCGNVTRFQSNSISTSTAYDISKDTNALKHQIYYALDCYNRPNWILRLECHTTKIPLSL